LRSKHFSAFTPAECPVIEERCRLELKLRLALQLDPLRMSGRVLDAVRSLLSALVVLA
jgi:hypothetical protein